MGALHDKAGAEPLLRRDRGWRELFCVVYIATALRQPVLATGFPAAIRRNSLKVTRVINSPRGFAAFGSKLRQIITCEAYQRTRGSKLATAFNPAQSSAAPPRCSLQLRWSVLLRR
jgi:hypothetical protein